MSSGSHQTHPQNSRSWSCTCLPEGYRHHWGKRCFCENQTFFCCSFQTLALNFGKPANLLILDQRPVTSERLLRAGGESERDQRVGRWWGLLPANRRLRSCEFAFVYLYVCICVVVYFVYLMQILATQLPIKASKRISLKLDNARLVMIQYGLYFVFTWEFLVLRMRTWLGSCSKKLFNLSYVMSSPVVMCCAFWNEI